MNGIIPGTIIPWLLGGLLLIVLITLSITVKSWREAKRSPYFFLRVQAAKRMQRYLLASLFVILLTVATTAYAWQAPEDTTPRLALLKNAKPVVSVETPADSTALNADAAPATVEITLAPGNGQVADTTSFSDLDAPLIQAAAIPESLSPTETDALPEERVAQAPLAKLPDGVQIGGISFSTNISNDYQPVEPSRRFTKGFFTLYATFEYQDMVDGVNWSWIWHRNGQKIDGGEQVWSYGDSGPGFVYLRPQEGFLPGEYDLEVWVADELMVQSNFTVIDGISASN